MELKLYTENIESYLKCDSVINYDNAKVSELANTLYESSENETDYIRKAYEYVRDNISHSADAGEDEVTCSAGEVFEAGHGICFAKSHLLAALLRAKSIPAGFCYQKLILDDETAPVLIYHGLNGVYIKEYDKWIRLDARGNKPGVNAQFAVDSEQLAFPIRPEKGEEDGFVIYPDPDKEIVKALKENTSRTKLWEELPMKLEYNEEEFEITDYITPEEYMAMRLCVGWAEFPMEEAAEGLKNTAFLCCIREDGKPIALGRAVGDHGYVVYIADIIVRPEYQGQGLGRKVMESLMSAIKGSLKPGYKMMISLLAAKGKEGFYKKFDFVDRPNEAFGCGMHQWIEGE